MNITNWKNEFTYTLGVQAFIYGFPYVYLPSIRYKWTNIPSEAHHVSPYVPLNTFWRASHMITSDYKDGGSPNNDTFYSIAILDLSKGPVILEHPDMEARYFTFELADMTSDNFDYIGQRATGSKAGKFLICHKGWKGELPPGVRKAADSPTPWGLIFGRTIVKDLEDAPVAYEISKHYRLTPLDFYLKNNKNEEFISTDRNVWKPYDVKKDYLAPWKTMIRTMKENPPPEKDNILLNWFSNIGIGPETDPAELDKVR